MTTQPKPRRILDRKYQRSVMQNEECVVPKMRDTSRPESVLAWSKGAPVIDWYCSGSHEFHHVKPYGGGITGGKVSDRRGVKVCKKHHDMVADRKRFEQRFGIDLEAEIQRLNAKYPPAKPARERKPSPKATVTIQNCRCGRSHQLPFSKVTIADGCAYYRCPLKNYITEAKV